MMPVPNPPYEVYSSWLNWACRFRGCAVQLTSAIAVSMSMSGRKGASFFLAVPPGAFIPLVGVHPLQADHDRRRAELRQLCATSAHGLSHCTLRQGKTEDAIFWFNAGRLRAQFDVVVPRLKCGQVA